MSIELRLNRVDKIYRAGETVSGVALIKTDASLSHNGFRLIAHGEMRPHVSARGMGIFDAAAASGGSDSVVLLHAELPMADAGKFPAGTTEIPFEFTVEPVEGMTLTETYHGVYVNVTYGVNAILTRGGFSRNIEEFIEFNVQVPSRGAVDPSPVEFEIRPDSLENVRKTSVAQIPKFRVRGILHQTSCSLSRAFTGQLVVEESEARIRSLELQLVRVESVATGAGGDMVTESTEIQNLQLGDGDVSRGLPLPIYMVFPRLFTCPTVVSERFRVEFEVNIIIIFEDNYMVTENFEVKLFR